MYSYDMDVLEPRITVKKLVPIFILLGIIFVILVVAGIVLYTRVFAAPEGNTEEERFIVSLADTNEEAIERLKREGFIKSTWGFLFALKQKRGDGNIAPGGYKISKSMSAWKVAGVLSQDPYLVWIVIPEGLRKEEIAEILQEKLGWSSEEREKWITTETATSYEYTEGVYFPDTYLIPKDEAPRDSAKRLQTHFEEVFALYAKEALKQNIRWYTVIRLASIVQREAAGQNDMPVIAGVLWNRLLKGVRLEVDATIQYARGKRDAGWWAPIRPEDKAIDSPYNTYKHTGLPPHPIANPGTKAIEAVLFPASTECLYYLHDSSGQIHCAQTFEEHKKNIDTYLR